ncbi:MAG: low affinity iron permease family protein [Planctomycetes bacterium]|nr:low affinity iron permease family protein [Planctomycetota bacterium]
MADPPHLTVRFLIVVLIRSTLNRETAALHIKLDELIQGVQGAHRALLDLEERSEDDLAGIRANNEKLAQIARE